MDILIHTSGRANIARQHTLKELVVLANIIPTLVVQYTEAGAYRDMLQHEALPLDYLHSLPEYIKTLAPTRDYIIHDMPGDDHVVFMDDDLNFAVRRTDEPTKFRPPGPGDLQEMFRHIDAALKEFPMVGIGAREGGNRVTEPVSFNSRIMRVLAFRRSYLKELGLTFSPMVVMEDFHINLQILRSGADTCILNRWVSNQAGGSDAPGGCSVYRSDAVQAEAAHMLAARHPGFVKVVQKQTKTAWGGKTRTDVIVQWKKARSSAL